MLAQREVARRFRDGATDGEASNLRIVQLAGGSTALQAFEHAIVAVRSPGDSPRHATADGGYVVAYGGWYQLGNRRDSGSPAIKNLWTRCNLWTADTIIATKCDGRRAIRGDERMTAYADVHTDSASAAPTIEDVSLSAMNGA